MNENPSIDAVKDRLDEIVAAVSDESISLDDALALYEEAVNLGLAACDLASENVADVAEKPETDTATADAVTE